MNRILLFLLCLIVPVKAIRNPFESPLVETNNVLVNCSKPIAQECLTLNSNSPWQVTEQDEATMILKNQSGEIRKVKIAHE